MKYLLDTDAVSNALRGVGNVGERLLQTAPSEVAVSSITEAELWYGAEKLGSRRLEDAIQRFLEPIACVPFDGAAAKGYGALRARLERRGTPIGNADTMIAAHAQLLGLILVTSNRKHFQRVRGLVCEDWR